MWKYCGNGSLGTRDVVARAIDSELKKSGDKNALLVTEHLDRKELVEEFPNIEKKLSTFGMNLGIDPIPVIPAAHYMVGGIDVDHSGRVRLGNSVIRGLYAIGEVARTGLHGANRLASNSLLEAVVYSERAAKDLIEKASICVNGISLTISKITNKGFQVWIIPHTYKETNLSNLTKFSLVNIEIDILSKYIRNYFYEK